MLWSRISSLYGEDYAFDLEKPNPAKHIVDFWKCRKVSEEQHANMTIDCLSLSVPLPKISATSKRSLVVKIPIAVVSRTMRKGDELVIFVPPKPKVHAEKRMLATTAPAATKQKVKR